MIISNPAMQFSDLVNTIKEKKSFLCIGLDTDIQKIPSFLLNYEDPVLEFNKQIIDATRDLCIAYKPNTAFYECRGLAGWQSLLATENYIPKGIFKIADSKRGDIGNTAEMYARAFFDKQSSGFDFDAITVAPYMGKDSVLPFLQFDKKWAIVLGLTSNSGSGDFQFLTTEKQLVYQEVISKAKLWGTKEKLMFVIGATRGEEIAAVRKIVPDHFFLVPGVGAQGGSLEEVCKYGMNWHCGLIVNASRSIIYASSGKDFAERAREEAQILQQTMAAELKRIGW